MASPIGSQLARSLVQALGDECGVAASLARFAASRPEERVTALDFAFLEGAGAAARVAAEFAARGWLVQDADGWHTPAAGAMPDELAAFLDGAAAMRGANPPGSHAAAVVTMPPPPSAIGRALPATGVAHAALVQTTEAFERVADSATVSLSVMTPFVNDEGLQWALQLFRRTRAPQRRLVVRAVPLSRRTISERRGEIQSAGVEVLSYALRVRDGPYYETFHAKVVLADASLAYVGSANFLAYARHSMELGILADGRAAQVIAGVVRAVESVADRVSL